MPEKFHVSYADVTARCEAIARPLGPYRGVYGIPRGGTVPAAIIAGLLGVPLLDQPEEHCLVVDDLVDSGKTLGTFQGEHPHLRYGFRSLWRKSYSPAVGEAELVPGDAWVVFPWEDEVGTPTDAVTRLLTYIGEDPTRDGLLDTPARVARSLAELTAGYQADVGALLGVTFDVACDEMVVVRGIDFVSLCEHHMLPFTGTASVAYVPGERVVGLSKIARLVDAYAQRLQVQERMTNQIADAMVEHLAPAGVGVIVEGAHACMGCRGVRKPGARMLTSALRGVLRDKPEARAEFLALAGQ